MNILKREIKSFCPVCFQEIPGQVYEEEGRVYISKSCQKDGAFKVLIENDALVYKKLMNQEYSQEQKAAVHFMFTATHSCNLECPICYLPEKDTSDLKLGDIKKAISNSQAQHIRISGGEPTLRKDLFEIIRFISQTGKVSHLITNGLKLAERSYAKELKSSGLNVVCFSFNGFNDTAYNKINGRKLLKLKMKALKNLKKEGMLVTLSVMLVKGINEKELKRLILFCAKNTGFIHELRLRSATHAGRHIPHEPLFMSEIIEKIGIVFRIDKHKLLNSFFNSSHHLPCCFDMDFLSLLAVKQTRAGEKDAKISRLILIRDLLSITGFWNTLMLIGRRIIKRRINFAIRIRNRFDGYNMDLSEIQRCNSVELLSDGETALPLCKAVALNDNGISL